METYQFIILIVLSVVSLALSLILLIYNLIKHPRGEGGSNERLVSAISEVETRPMRFPQNAAQSGNGSSPRLRVSETRPTNAFDLRMFS